MFSVLNARLKSDCYATKIIVALVSISDNTYMPTSSEQARPRLPANITFGLVALEALHSNVPLIGPLGTLVSRQAALPETQAALLEYERPKPVDTTRHWRGHLGLLMLAHDYTTKQISSLYDIQPVTVDTHIETLIHRLHAHSRPEALRHLVEQGSVFPPVIGLPHPTQGLGINAQRKNAQAFLFLSLISRGWRSATLNSEHQYSISGGYTGRVARDMLKVSSNEAAVWKLFGDGLFVPDHILIDRMSMLQADAARTIHP